MTIDDFGHPYPSREGAYEQMVQAITDSSFEDRWYSFDELVKASNSGKVIKGIRAFSYDEAGEEDQTYEFWWA